MVPLHKGKGDMYECSNLIGISLLSAVDKLFGRVMIKVGAGTECGRECRVDDAWIKCSF